MASQPSLSVPLRQLKAQEFIDIITLKDKLYYADFYQENEDSGEVILIKNVEIIDNVELTASVTVKLFLIIESGLFKTFKLNGCCFLNDFRLIEATFQNDFWISEATFQNEFWIEGGTFQSDFRIDGGAFQNDFNIYGGIFQNDFRIDGGNFETNFGIYGGIFQSSFWIYGGTFQNEFRIEGGTFQNDFRINEGYLNRFIVINLVFKISLLISEDSFINYIEINGTVPKDSLVRISGSLYALNFADIQNFGTIVLNQLSYREQLYIPKDVIVGAPPSDNVINQLNQPELRIENSDLGKTTFINCDLSGFGLYFKSSKITEVFVTGTQMPRKITNTDPTQQQLGYSQIKKIYEARGDRVEANRYYAQEMEAYLTKLSWRSWDGFWEKLNLILNKYSTYYGQSWQRGLLSTLLVSGFFYILYCFFLAYKLTWPTHISLDVFWELASYFLEFLNPIHKADYVAEQLAAKEVLVDNSSIQTAIHISGWARTIEGISRIFIAYFVYQFIQAFRKHGKVN